MSTSKSDLKLIHELHEEIKTLRAENKALRKLVKDLKEKLNTNSRNSSKSPSQDPYRSRKGRKKHSEKRQGAQQGHKGHARGMAPPEDVVEFRDIHPPECPHCGGDEFIFDPIHTEKRQVTELPEIQPHVIQFNIWTNDY